MITRTHHVFFSYARKDNEAEKNNFITRFDELLRRQHEAVSGIESKAFLDRQANWADWSNWLEGGLHSLCEDESMGQFLEIQRKISIIKTGFSKSVAEKSNLTSYCLCSESARMLVQGTSKSITK